MKRNNFYMLLDLPLNPPEENQEKIEATIKKKQAEWSKQRNHPTRGIQAKQFIGLIPEIKRVMTDPGLRKQEAENANKLIAKKNEEKFAEIDRHLSIYNSKGIVTSKEIQKLVKIHSVETDEILKWMLKRERDKKTAPESKTKNGNKATQSQEKKLEEILSSLLIRMRKGYILEEEIAALSKTYNVDQHEILQNIQFPVRTEKDPLPDDAPKALDPSIIKTINTNLKIIRKKTLYDFLELPVGSKLEALRNRAVKIQQDLLGISKKDAAVTAGSILAGHCRTIFKAEETRISYDIARAQSILKTLDSDIGIAEFDGVIQSEYTEAIARNAAEFGMSYEEALDYIEEYSAQQGWKVQSKEKKKRLIKITAISISLILVTIIASVALIMALKSRRLSQEFNQVIAVVDAQKILEDKKQELLKYIRSHEKNPFTIDANKRVKQIGYQIKKRNALDEQDYKSALQKVATLTADQQYEQAEIQYKKYIKKHPVGKHVMEFKKAISEIPNLIETRNFQAINQISKTDLQKRLDAAIQYLKNHPQGKFHSDVVKTIANMEESYFTFIRKKIAKHEKRKQWQECINLCDQYFIYFPDSKHENQLKGEQYFFTKQLEKTNLLQKLEKQVEMKKNDTQAIIKIYTDYINANPKSPIQYEVKKKLSTYRKKNKK